ncbi:hypothetical protein HK100_009361 [Physocladia obscura]|uniref:Uncharacterized protein n=1 Tax=Physocladia obscura TaxID=109957 RepID=A0AAD5T3A8_9FUNG|nr:hypothetical protein HK100_009361 [Physocladia obscura]
MGIAQCVEASSGTWNLPQIDKSKTTTTKNLNCSFECQDSVMYSLVRANGTAVQQMWWCVCATGISWTPAPESACIPCGGPYSESCGVINDGTVSSLALMPILLTAAITTNTRTERHRTTGITSTDVHTTARGNNSALRVGFSTASQILVPATTATTTATTAVATVPTPEVSAWVVATVSTASVIIIAAILSLFCCRRRANQARTKLHAFVLDDPTLERMRRDVKTIGAANGGGSASRSLALSKDETVPLNSVLLKFSDGGYGSEGVQKAMVEMGKVDGPNGGDQLILQEETVEQRIVLEQLQHANPQHYQQGYLPQYLERHQRQQLELQKLEQEQQYLESLQQRHQQSQEQQFPNGQQIKKDIQQQQQQLKMIVFADQQKQLQEEPAFPFTRSDSSGTLSRKSTRRASYELASVSVLSSSSGTGSGSSGSDGGGNRLTIQKGKPYITAVTRLRMEAGVSSGVGDSLLERAADRDRQVVGEEQSHTGLSMIEGASSAIVVDVTDSAGVINDDTSQLCLSPIEE